MSGDSMEGTKKMVRFGENKVKEFQKTQRIIPDTDKNDKRTEQRIQTGQKPIHSALEKDKQSGRADKSEEAKLPAPPLRSILKKTAVLPMVLPDLPTTEKKKKKKKEEENFVKTRAEECRQTVRLG